MKNRRHQSLGCRLVGNIATYIAGFVVKKALDSVSCSTCQEALAPSMDRDLVVTVLFDFEYHSSDGQRVHMHKDEEFLVIQQTNSDWWQVIRSGERKPFYAPTQYLKVQPRPRPQLPPKVKPVKRNARDSRRAPLSITDAERHISCEDDAPGDETPGRRRCNSLEDAAAGSSSVETLDDSPPAPVSRPAPGGTPQATELPAAAGGQSDATPGRGATPRLPPSRHRRPRISKDLWARRKSWSVDERSRTWELVRPEAAPAPAAATSTATAAMTEPGPGPKTVIGARAEPGVGTDPRPPRPAERPVPTPRPTVEAAERRPTLPSAVNKPPPPPVPVPVTAVPAAVEATAPRQPAGSNTEAAGPKREHGRFKQEVLKLISRSRRSEERRSSDGAPSRSRPTAEFWDRSGPRQQDGRPAPPPAAQKRPTTLERETVTSGDRSAPISGVIMKSASVELTRTVAGPVEQAVAAERAERGPRPDVLPSADGAESPPGLHRQTSYDRSLQSFSTFSNLRSARIDLAGHNASFKRTAERLRRPPDREADRSRRPTAGRQVEPPRVDGPPRPPVPPKTLQLRLQPAADGLPTTPDDGDWSDSEPAGSESESGSWERLDQMKAALYFANPLMPRSGLSRSADHLPVPLPRTRLTEISPPQSRQPPPVPHILETPIRSLHDGWGEYLHHGRKYYYNVDTQSSTWKPPRRNVKSPATSPDKSVSDPSRPTAEAGTPVLEVDVPLVPLPPGWRRRVDSTGELCYVRDSSPTRGVSDTTRLV
ncbi:hypothetical protein FJT64_007928 [Amphibalanus amphitrite]|uniref:Rho GTPase-activating protein 27 n=1 Tax=Amphibalanus amphitrite TaxID=1232801 RepID=A0A6A4VN50_AMPAM|nr:hypothetical protein FJT64_007928 [Amphibalanus amphitrite]